MKGVLVACERSQRVTISFRELGYKAFSCDLEPEYGGRPEWHIQADVIPLLNDGWDMVIAFPPCTHLSYAGARYFKQKIANGRQDEGVKLFSHFIDIDCPHVAIENPRGIVPSFWRQPDQVIQPYWFGDTYRKATCLWLKGLPPLFATCIESERNEYLLSTTRQGNLTRSDVRSRTFWGIARAMAQQWAPYLRREDDNR